MFMYWFILNEKETHNLSREQPNINTEIRRPYSWRKTRCLKQVEGSRYIAVPIELNRIEIRVNIVCLLMY